MRLRLRCVDSKETLKLEVPVSCSLLQFKQIIAQSLGNSSSSASIRLSLNRKDELKSEGEESLQTLGVASGDLIFFSFEKPDAEIGSNFQIQMESNIAECYSMVNSHDTDQSSDSMDVETEGGKRLDKGSTNDGILGKMEIDGGYTGITGDSDDFNATDAQNFDSGAIGTQRRKALSGGSETEESMGKMEIDDGEMEIIGKSDVSSSPVPDKSFSVPGFLRKVLTEELSNNGAGDHKLITIAVHAVMLESGFVPFDKNSNMISDSVNFWNDWSSGLFRLALHYTLPESIRASQVEATKTVFLKFQSMGDFINIFGTVDADSVMRNVYRVQLNEEKLIPYLNIVWANCCDIENSIGVDGIILPEKEVFKFWKTVKDSLALPLSIDLCEESGLELPPCFMRLPTDLKLKILESLPGIDLARVTCVCSELRYLASSDDLWKLKFLEDFPNQRNSAETNWKTAFFTAWTFHKASILAEQARVPLVLPAMHHDQLRRWYPNPFMVPRWPRRIIGGDYDIAPLPGGGIRRPPLNSMKRISPSSLLGGRFT